MAAPTTAVPVLRMKLLIDTKSRRVLFAEAGKDAVDFLFSLLALPLATATALLGTASMAGSVGTLYASADSLDDSYVLPGADRDALLRPPLAASPAATATSTLLLLPPTPPSSYGGRQKGPFFRCGYVYGYGGACSSYVTDARGATCPNCRRPMTEALQYVPPSPAPACGSGACGQMATRDAVAGGAVRGFVQGVVTYTVRDDLTVTPMSSISSITLLNAFAVTDITALREKIVRLGYREGLAILKASLQSKTVLTDVFLGKKSPSHA